MKARFILLLVVMMTIVPLAGVSGQDSMEITLLGTYTTGVFDEGAAEIAAYDSETQSLFVVNGGANAIDIISIADPAAPSLTGQIDVTEYGDGANSVDIYNGVVAVAIEADPKSDPGVVGFFTTAGEFISSVPVGALPDMITFTPDGTKVLTANEGEPNDDYSVDAEGTVSIIDISGGVEAVTDASVTTVGFADATLPEGVRIFGPNATQAQDIEPEYVAISDDSATAYVTLQENNALAVIDLATGSLSAVVALGTKDHSVEGNGMDTADEEGAITIIPRPVLGMYMPDGIAAYTVDGATYLVTANEGDAREYEDVYAEEVDLEELALDATIFPNAEELQNEGVMGDLAVSSVGGDTDGDGDYDVLYTYGARSFSIWAADGTLVFDSGDQLEQITAAAFPDDFNSTNDENGSFDNRSDNKGPEPEGVDLGVIDGQTYAFIGLERIGGVVVFNVTDPTAPSFVTYVNNRDFSGDAEAGTAGDLGPEGVLFIAAESSPTGAPLLVTANEISGSTSVFSISLP